MVLMLLIYLLGLIQDNTNRVWHIRKALVPLHQNIVLFLTYFILAVSSS